MVPTSASSILSDASRAILTSKIHQLEFVDKAYMVRAYRCSECENVAIRHFISGNCNHIFCLDCYYQVYCQPCPVCKTVVTRVLIDREFEMTIGNLKVRCEFMKNGCQEIICLAKYLEHAEVCRHGQGEILPKLGVAASEAVGSDQQAASDDDLKKLLRDLIAENRQLKAAVNADSEKQAAEISELRDAVERLREENSLLRRDVHERVAMVLDTAQFREALKAALSSAMREEKLVAEKEERVLEVIAKHEQSSQPDAEEDNTDHGGDFEPGSDELQRPNADFRAADALMQDLLSEVKQLKEVVADGADKHERETVRMKYEFTKHVNATANLILDRVESQLDAHTTAVAEKLKPMLGELESQICSRLKKVVKKDMDQAEGPVESAGTKTWKGDADTVAKKDMDHAEGPFEVQETALHDRLTPVLSVDQANSLDRLEQGREISDKLVLGKGKMQTVINRTASPWYGQKLRQRDGEMKMVRQLDLKTRKGDADAVAKKDTDRAEGPVEAQEAALYDRLKTKLRPLRGNDQPSFLAQLERMREKSDKLALRKLRRTDVDVTEIDREIREMCAEQGGEMRPSAPARRVSVEAQANTLWDGLTQYQLKRRWEKCYKLVPEMGFVKATDGDWAIDSIPPQQEGQKPRRKEPRFGQWIREARPEQADSKKAKLVPSAATDHAVRRRAQNPGAELHLAGAAGSGMWTSLWEPDGSCDPMGVTFDWIVDDVVLKIAEKACSYSWILESDVFTVPANGLKFKAKVGHGPQCDELFVSLNFVAKTAGGCSAPFWHVRKYVLVDQGGGEDRRNLITTAEPLFRWRATEWWKHHMYTCGRLTTVEQLTEVGSRYVKDGKILIRIVLEPVTTMPKHLASMDGTLLLRIDNYARRKRDHVKKRMPLLNTEPFYTGPKGHRVQVSLDFGARSALGPPGIMLCLEFLVGEYDSVHSGPILCTYERVIVDQSGLVEGRDMVCEKRFLLSGAGDAPFRDFVAHNDVEWGPYYLKEDTLLIKITVEPSTL